MAIRTGRLAWPIVLVLTCFGAVGSGLLTDAHAVILDNWNAALTADNSFDFINTTSEDKNWERRSALETLNASTTCANFRYRHLLAMDVRLGNSSSEQQKSSYTVAFQVVAAPLEQWWISIDSRRKGRLVVLDDGCGRARAEFLTAVSAVYTMTPGSGPTQMGSIDFDAPVPANNEGDDTDPDTPSIINESGRQCLSGTGTVNIVLKFEWTTLVASNPTAFPNPLCANGDEAAVVFGISGGLPDTDADNTYNQSDFGHFVTVCLVPPPTAQATGFGACSNAEGTACVLRLDGITQGCIDDTWDVYVTFFGDGNQINASPVQATKGPNGVWTALYVVTPGPCDDHPYTWSIVAIDNLIAGDIGPEQAVATGVAVLLGQGAETEATEINCDGSVQSVPGFGPWASIVALALLAVTGVFVMSRRSAFA